MRLHPRRLATAAAATALAASTVAGVVATPASASLPPRISRYGFSMHFTGLGRNPYPNLPFSSARTQNMGVSWADLQPTSATWDTAVVNRLHSIVNAFHRHGVRPLVVLGMTPDWAKASSSCQPAFAHTCPPRYAAWRSYVSYLAHHFRGVDFETWNEPNLHSSFADNTAHGAAIMAWLQSIAYSQIHNVANGDRLVSPSVAVTPGNEFTWLKAFFHARGGRRFDYFGIHLYPVDKAARGGYGPEWSVAMLGRIRSLLRYYRLGGKQVWDTEMNIGRQPSASPTSRQYNASVLGAAMVARTYLLQLSRGVSRVYWYAADDQTWGGTWLQKTDERTLTYGGRAEKALHALIVNARPYGCSASYGRWTCRFVLANGKHMLAKWTTRHAYYMHAPAGSQRLYHPLGGYRSIRRGTTIRVGAVPQYIWGNVSI